MNKFKSRVIRGALILLVIILLAIVPQINAEETASDENANSYGRNAINKAGDEYECTNPYGLRIEATNEDNKYKIIKDNNDPCCKDEDATFTVIGINGTGVTNGGIVKANSTSPVTFSAGLMKKDENTYNVIVTLKNNNPPGTEKITLEYLVEKEKAIKKDIGVSNVHFYGICATYKTTAGVPNTKKYEFFKSSLPYCWQTRVIVNYSAEELTNKVNNINSLWKIYENQNNTTTGDLEKFKENALKIVDTTDKKLNVIEDPSKKITLNCPYNIVKTGADAPVEYTNKYGESISSTEYYLNTDYYYSSSISTDGTVKYIYNYAPGNVYEDEKTNVCERTCEEAVKVEYGPPVASKAGLCFEYKVKVTSYVNCRTDFKAEAPTTHTAYCNPAPECSNGSFIRENNQAGPSEEFESCIQLCDGGKYTEKCSIKCYNETYATLPKLAISYDNVKRSLLPSTIEYSTEECLVDNKNHYGCYVQEGKNSSGNPIIKWVAYNYTDTYISYPLRYKPLGRWYIEHPEFNATSGNRQYKKELDTVTKIDNRDAYKYIADANGFIRNQKTSSGGECNDTCSWVITDECNNTPYWNPGSMAKDNKTNQDAYDDAKRKCIASASCSTHTAEFSISVNYDTTTGETKKVNTISFPYESKEPDKLEASKDNDIADSSRSTILDYAGCYKDKNAGNNYMTEWGFPGTYIHNKTGEISFKRPDVPDGWYYDNKKFCVPLDADTVNSKWWEWYKLGNNCYTNAEIEEELNSEDGNNPRKTSNGYNITATTQNFGYFGWNFDIKCFYGLRNEICNIDKKGCCSLGTPTETNGVSNYTFRSVAIDNLFPNAVEEGVVDPDKRPIGFNWTSKALSLKNSGYEVNPTALINHIESNASTLYSDEATNLDYRFYLTPATLAKIKSYNNNHNYSTWDGTVEEKNGINVYKSNLFRNVGTGTKVLTEVTGSIIKLGEPGINNENYIKFGG